MLSFLTLLLLTYSSIAGGAIDGCPSALRPQGKDCVYHAGDLTATDFSCSVMKGQFGDLNCFESAGKSCEAWAIDTCGSIKKKCDRLAVPGALRRYAGKDLEVARTSLSFCRNATFTILDSAGAPDPAKPPVSPEELRASSLKSSVPGGDTYTNDSLPVVPSFQDALPEDYKMCLGRTDLEQGDWVRVSTASFPGATPRTNYSIRKRGGQFDVKMNFFLTYRGDPADRDEVVGKILRAKGCIEQFFVRHKINLQLGFHTEGGLRAWYESDIADVYISKHSDKGISTTNWALVSPSNNNQELPPAGLCGVLAHEVAHRMGLPDRYADPNVPDREQYLAPDDTLMNLGVFGVHTAYLTDADLRIITEPLCAYETTQVRPVPTPAPTPRAKPY